ncbi:MAG: hypothetical protein COC05_04290 [Gammaproteobacteria bacterium]|nr:MAG: hypothetical protein COC05_04290 [Gammaproteobacteria bacterium]
MKHYAGKLLIVVSIMLSAGCDSEPRSSRLSQSPESTVSVQGSQADNILNHLCGGCHVLPKPATKTAAEWPSVVWRMQTHRSQRAMQLLSETEINEITEYLIQNAKEQ